MHHDGNESFSKKLILMLPIISELKFYRRVKNLGCLPFNENLKEKQSENIFWSSLFDQLINNAKKRNLLNMETISGLSM